MYIYIYIYISRKDSVIEVSCFASLAAVVINN